MARISAVDGETLFVGEVSDAKGNKCVAVTIQRDSERVSNRMRCTLTDASAVELLQVLTQIVTGTSISSSPESFDEISTGLHEAIPDPVEREREISRLMLLDAVAGNRGTDQQAIAREVVRWGALLLRKNRDYGSSVWQRPLLAPDCEPGTAIRVRMSDKLNRLISLLSRPAEVADETLDDTLRDLGAYCLLEVARPRD